MANFLAPSNSYFARSDQDHFRPTSRRFSEGAGKGLRQSVWLIDRTLDDALIAQDQAAADLAYLGLTRIARQNTMPAASLQAPPKKTKGKSAKKRAAKSVRVAAR